MNNNGVSVRSKRMAAGIAGHVLCKKIGKARTWLSDIENGYLAASPEELTQIGKALDDLILAKREIQKTAAAVGWPGAVEVAV